MTASDPSNPPRMRRALIAEDDSVCRLSQEILEGEAVADGAEALRRVRAVPGSVSH